MCSEGEGVSVWFACKLCPSFFLNADDFAYHKKKSHVHEFRSTKFIVFEEQTTPTASPPENWVSFLPPREETIIHKIIPSQPPPSTTNVACVTSNENVKTNPRKEFIEIDFESNAFTFNNREGGSYGGSQVSNNSFELNSNFNSNDEADKILFAVDIQETDLVQSSIEPTSTDSDLTDKTRDKLCSSRTKATLKSAANNLERCNKKISNAASKKTLLQAVIQSPNIPYVHLERLNFRTIPNSSSSHSNNTIDSHENNKSDSNHTNSSAKSANQPKDKDAEQKNIITSNSTFPSPPLMVAVRNCKLCSEHFNSSTELQIHEDICRLRSQFENILCVSCFLTFASSDELIRHNHEFHFVSISNPTAETVIGHPTAVSDDLEVAPKKQIQSDILSNVCNTSTSNSSLTKTPLSIKTDDDLHNIDFNPDLDLDNNAVSNAENNYCSGTPSPNLSYGDQVQVVKMEPVADENENCELPSEDHVPFESVGALEVESSVEPTLNLSSCSSSNLEVNHHELLIIEPHSSRSLCVSCQKYFISIRDIKIHNRTHHRTQGGKGNFTCPHPNCEKTSTNQQCLNCHVIQVHSVGKSFKCPHPNCGKAFKRQNTRNTHYKRHSNTFARYCFSCKKYFTTCYELRNHNQTYHMTKEGKLFFNCPYPNCGRAFKTRGVLKRHLTKVHSKVSPFK